VSAVANVAINVDSRNAVSKLRQVQTQAQSTEKAFGALQSAIGALGVGFALTKVIADVKELDTNLRRLGTVGGNVAALDKGLGALSDRLDGVANKAELAAASYQALSAGFTETGANLRVVEAATKAAVGGMVDVTAATEVTTKVLNAYNMSGDQATKVTDSIAKSIEYGVVQWSDYTSQLGRVASISAVAGVSLDEINAFIAAATKNSATAEIAFTGLGATLSNMLRPTTESAKAAAALGINWNLAGIRGEGFESLMGKLGIAMQKNPVLANQMVGGQEAVRGAFAAAAKGGKDYAMILEGLGGAAGKTDADFQTMKGSLENTLKALDTSFKNLSEALGTAFGPTVVIVIRDITKAVNGFADFMSAVPQPVMDTTGTIIKLVAQMLLVQKGIQGIIALRAGVIGMLAATAGSAASAGTAAGAAATKVNMLKSAMLGLLKFAVVTLAVDIVISGLGKLAEVQARMNAITKGSTKQFAEQIGGSALSRQEIEKLKKENLAERARRVQEKKDVKAPLVTAQDDIAQAAILELDMRYAQLQTMGEKAKFLTPADRALSDSKLTATTGGGGGGEPAGGKGDNAAKKLEAEAKKRAEEAARLKASLGVYGIELGLKRQIYDIDNKIFVASLEKDKETQIRLKGEKELLRVNSEIAKVEFESLTPQERTAKLASLAVDEVMARRDTMQELITLNREVDDQAKAALGTLSQEGLLLQSKLQGKEQEYQKQLLINQIMEENPTLIRSEVEALVSKNEALKGQMKAAEELKSLYSDIGMSIKNGVVDAIQSAIDGTKSLQEVASNLLQNIANKLIDVAMNMALFGVMSGTGIGGGLLGGLFKPKAAGGPVAGGGNYLVGEKGPELFVPSTAGTIIPADATAAAMARYQRQGGGSGGGNSGSDAMGDGAAATPVLSMSFETTRFLGQDYVSTDQLQAAMMATERRAAAAGAKAGAAQVTSKLQQSPAYRRQVGLR
jgi:TP901 family phage tail tape measure protein